MYSYGSPHTAAQKQDVQHEHTFSSYVRIQVVVLKTYLGRWTIGRSGERGSGISVLPARYDDDDDISFGLVGFYGISTIVGYLMPFLFYTLFWHDPYFWYKMDSSNKDMIFDCNPVAREIHARSNSKHARICLACKEVKRAMGKIELTSSRFTIIYNLYSSL